MPSKENASVDFLDGTRMGPGAVRKSGKTGDHGKENVMQHAARIVAIIAMAAFCSPQIALAQTPETSTPQPSASPSVSSEPEARETQPAATSAQGGVDLSKLTPAQQAELQQAIIKASQNPVGNIAILPFQFNNNYGIGPYTRYQFNMNFQPVVPIMLSKNLNLIARSIIPVVNNPSSAPPSVCASKYGCGSTFGIGDIQQQFFFAPKTKPGALVWGAGPLFQIPSATPGVLGTGKWSAGPALVGLVLPGPWVIGMLVTQLWSFAGKPNQPNVNSGLFQPFINYNLKGGWALTTGPIITVNYAAPGNQKWSVPIGGGGGKTFKLGDQTMQINMFYYTYIQKPLYTPQTNLRLVWSLLFPVKRGIDIQGLLQENAGAK